jgi:ATP-dependent DNA ligase
VRAAGAEGLTSPKWPYAVGFDPFIVVRIEFLEWTAENHLRRPRFAGIRSDNDPRERG